MNDLTIGEIARRVGLQTSAIRYYESIGLLPTPPRAGGQRRYDESVLARLRMIQLSREIGFSLQEIRVLLDGFPAGTPPSARWAALAESKLPEVEALIERATTMKGILQAGLLCECASLEECFAEEGRPDIR